MKMVVEGVMDATLPWGFVLVGVGLALLAEIARIPSLPLAVGIYLPITTTIDGTGMTPGQILPDFTSAVTGTIAVDLDPLSPLASGSVLADVVSLSINVLVPEPSTALLVGMGLALLGARRMVRVQPR